MSNAFGVVITTGSMPGIVGMKWFPSAAYDESDMEYGSWAARQSAQAVEAEGISEDTPCRVTVVSAGDSPVRLFVDKTADEDCSITETFNRHAAEVEADPSAGKDAPAEIAVAILGTVKLEQPRLAPNAVTVLEAGAVADNPDIAGLVSDIPVPADTAVISVAEAFIADGAVHINLLNTDDLWEGAEHDSQRVASVIVGNALRFIERGRANFALVLSEGGTKYSLLVAPLNTAGAMYGGLDTLSAEERSQVLRFANSTSAAEEVVLRDTPLAARWESVTPERSPEEP